MVRSASVGFLAQIVGFLLKTAFLFDIAGVAEILPCAVFFF
jgi:hypothetical protein